jgi:hypothetical protein
MSGPVYGAEQPGSNQGATRDIPRFPPRLSPGFVRVTSRLSPGSPPWFPPVCRRTSRDGRLLGIVNCRGGRWQALRVTVFLVSRPGVPGARCNIS